MHYMKELWSDRWTIASSGCCHAFCTMNILNVMKCVPVVFVWRSPLAKKILLADRIRELWNEVACKHCRRNAITAEIRFPRSRCSLRQCSRMSVRREHAHEVGSFQQCQLRFTHVEKKLVAFSTWNTEGNGLVIQAVREKTVETEDQKEDATTSECTHQR